MLQFECDESCCPFGQENCGNRALQTLSKDLREGRRYSEGYEVIEVSGNAILSFEFIIVLTRLLIGEMGCGLRGVTNTENSLLSTRVTSSPKLKCSEGSPTSIEA